MKKAEHCGPVNALSRVADLCYVGRRNAHPVNENAAILPRSPRAVFIAAWALAAAVSVTAFAFFAVGAVFSNILFYRLRDKFPGITLPPLPRITNWYIHGCGWALLLPPAFIAAAFWLCRSSVFSPERLAAYSGISIATIAWLISFAAVALSVPYMTIVPDFSSPFWPK